MERFQSSSSGSSAAYGVPAGKRPAWTSVTPRVFLCMARTRRVMRSAFSFGPKAIVSMTCAVRLSRPYGSSKPVECAKSPTKATGWQACISSARWPESATANSRCTVRSIESSVK